jgi:hypothetical protein
MDRHEAAAAVSVIALMQRMPIAASFAQNGVRPHHSRSSWNLLMDEQPWAEAKKSVYTCLPVLHRLDEVLGVLRWLAVVAGSAQIYASGRRGSMLSKFCAI